ncbi:hypothetical protein DAPPUDRAFT_325774 [Daphnia pulex]|uniref:SCP domain-containing protein n=1 Tax=Daphnia pulex TaxID=6669 RepID=E9H5I7_DAPPU|nr:hypothetical protein DAPPUDRAFT_325774 [Daphnia pulex]|eukprot:EFX72964.1 hypothetical protein DAPPUDRAFT_325774 [Daphnia pulex]
MSFKSVDILAADEGATGNDLEDRAFSTFSLECLQAHNDYRKKHGVPPLVLDLNVTAAAENWAKTMAAENTLAYSDNKNYGENQYFHWGRRQVIGRNPVDSFYEEIEDYNFNDPEGPGFTSHFTQVVWKSTKLMGVGVAKSGDQGIYVAVFYYPKGNRVGQFAANVLRPL